MQLNQLSSYNKYQDNDLDNYVRSVDRDFINLFLFAQGRVRFGEGDNGKGENIAGKFLTFTSNGVANTEDTIATGLEATPIGYIVTKQDTAGVLYSGTTAWDETNIYLKSSVASTTYKIFLLK
jgi:hypothetical protein